MNGTPAIQNIKTQQITFCTRFKFCDRITPLFWVCDRLFKQTLWELGPSSALNKLIHFPFFLRCIIYIYYITSIFYIFYIYNSILLFGVIVKYWALAVFNLLLLVYVGIFWRAESINVIISNELNITLRFFFYTAI